MFKQTFKVTEMFADGEVNTYELRAYNLRTATQKAQHISDADSITVEAIEGCISCS